MGVRQIPCKLHSNSKKETHVSTQRELCVQSDQSLTAQLLINPGGMWDQASNHFIRGFTVARSNWLTFISQVIIWLQMGPSGVYPAQTRPLSQSLCWHCWRFLWLKPEITSRSDPDQIQIRTTLTPSSVTGFTHTEERVNVSQHSHISRRYQSSEGRVSRKQGNDAFGFSGRQFLPQGRFYNPYRSDDQGNVTNRGKYTLLTLTLVP